jgi:hypothetical protein
MHFVFKIIKIIICIIIIINDIATKFWYTLKKFNLIIEQNSAPQLPLKKQRKNMNKIFWCRIKLHAGGQTQK